MSTYSQTRAVGNVANDAEFRIWGVFLSDSMQSAGWTKTADTGQIDWTTVARAAGTNTSQGYEIRKSPTQAGYTDFYLKIEYGSAASVSLTSLWITIGTGSNGSGTLTGVVSSRVQRPGAAATGGVEDLVSGGNDWLCILSNFQTGGAASVSGQAIAIDRWTDADGNYLTDGLTCHAHTSGNGYLISIDSSALYTEYASVVLGYLPPSYIGTAGTIKVAPAMRNLPGEEYPMQACCYVGISNTGGGSTHSFAIFPGKTQTWRGSEQSSNDLSIDAPENLCMLIRWE
jgi:hypothetical protein